MRRSASNKGLDATYRLDIVVNKDILRASEEYELLQTVVPQWTPLLEGCRLTAASLVVGPGN